jgi:dTDP-4-amino-4,6-dideoxygalactose transaminase
MRREFGVGDVFLVSSGSAALAVALLALKSLSPRREVVVPAYTCYSVPAAVLKAGLRPVLCDIHPGTFDYDDACLQETLSANTLCVVAHHLFGVPSDIPRTRALCRARRIFVVEDAAQAMGVELGGRRLGTLGDVGIFSFGRGKNITCGAGGAILTNSSEIAAAIASRYQELQRPAVTATVRDFARLVLMKVFIRPRLYWIPAAVPFLRLGETIFPEDVPLRRMTGLKAGLLRNWQERLSHANQIRRRAASDFAARLPVDGVQHHPYLRLPVFAASADDKKTLYSRSRACGLGLSPGYPAPLSDLPQIRPMVNGRQFPSARRVADCLLTIPTHHWLSERDKHAIAALWRDRASA